MKINIKYSFNKIILIFLPETFIKPPEFGSIIQETFLLFAVSSGKLLIGVQ